MCVCVCVCARARALIKSENYIAEEPPFCADNIALYITDYFLGVKRRGLLECGVL